MQQILIRINRRFLKKTFWVSKYRRNIPASWTDIPQSKRLSYVKMLSVLTENKALLKITQDILRFNDKQFLACDNADIATIATNLKWMRLDPSSTPIITQFSYKSQTYALPRAEFLGGTSYEFALADGYYQNWIENPDDAQALLQVVATLCREYNGDLLTQTGDARTPLSNFPENEIEQRANYLKDLDFSIVIAVLRYFEGVKKQVHEYGTASGIFEVKEEDAETPPTSKALFGWWTAFRQVAKSQLKTEEQVWAMSLWRVLSIMIEEKHKADEAERQMKNTTNG